MYANVFCHFPDPSVEFRPYPSVEHFPRVVWVRKQNRMSKSLKFSKV